MRNEHRIHRKKNTPDEKGEEIIAWTYNLCWEKNHFPPAGRSIGLGLNRTGLALLGDGGKGGGPEEKRGGGKGRKTDADDA